MRNTMLKLAAASGFVAALVAGAAAQAEASGYPYLDHVEGSLPKCQEEDGSGQELCIWVASDQGNGRGATYIVHDGGTRDASYMYLYTP